MNVFEKLAATLRLRERSRLDEFKALVRAIASGTEPNADEVERILNACGRSIDDLKKAVELYQRRVLWRELLDSLPRLEAERESIERRLAEADAELQAAERKHAKVTTPLRNRLEELRQATLTAENYRQRLVETCPNEELRERASELRRQLAEVSDRAHQLRQQINYHKSWTNVHLAEGESHDQHEAKIRECEKELSKLQKQIADLEQQLAATRDRMLEP